MMDRVGRIPRKIYIAGHTGLVGSALVRRLAPREGLRLLTIGRDRLDLAEGRSVWQFLEDERPDTVIMAAGRVGGILANATFPAEHLYDNLTIATNLIHGAWRAGVKRLLHLGSSCMYPQSCPQPMTPDRIMAGRLESTSEPTAIAKLAGWALCSAYRRQYGAQFMTLIPCGLYGPGDSFDPDTSHVLPALIQRFHTAKEARQTQITLWGSGTARREYLYVDDVAEACALLLDGRGWPDPMNVGSGVSMTISALATAVADVVGFRGTICWDRSQPDGTPEKLLDSRVIRGLGWTPRTGLQAGLTNTYRWFLDHYVNPRRADTACVSS